MTGLRLYDLAHLFCEECGTAKLNRLLMGVTGCSLCDEAVTRHRCEGRPGRDSMADGETWECPDCGTAWTAVTERADCYDCCGSCGHEVDRPGWERKEGDRMDTAPRHVPRAWLPYRPLPLLRLPPRKPSPGSCHVTASGIRVHVKPGCRCPKEGR